MRSASVRRVPRRGARAAAPLAAPVRRGGEGALHRGGRLLGLRPQSAVDSPPARPPRAAGFERAGARGGGVSGRRACVARRTTRAPRAHEAAGGAGPGSAEVPGASMTSLLAGGLPPLPCTPAGAVHSHPLRDPSPTHTPYAPTSTHTHRAPTEPTTLKHSHKTHPARYTGACTSAREHSHTDPGLDPTPHQPHEHWDGNTPTVATLTAPRHTLRGRPPPPPCPELAP